MDIMDIGGIDMDRYLKELHAERAAERAARQAAEPKTRQNMDFSKFVVRIPKAPCVKRMRQGIFV